MKISVIGTGRVGGAIGFVLVARGIPGALVLVGRNPEKARGNANDLLHAATFVRPMSVCSGDLDATSSSDVVILAVSAGTENTVDRASGVVGNVKLLREVVPTLAKASPEAVFVVVTNPVDVSTYETLRASNRHPRQVLGTGTLVDTGRFRALLSRETGINSNDIRAYVLGDHGESQFPALSVATAGGVHFDTGDATVSALFAEARSAGNQVMRDKGYTNYAVAMSVSVICEAIAGNTHTILPVSTLVDGFHGVSDVCLSLPCVIGRGGVEKVLAIDLNDEEVEQLRRSAAMFRKVRGPVT